MNIDFSKVMNTDVLLLQQKTNTERLWRDAELARADIEVLKAQDGSDPDTEKGWRDYRVQLRNWPTSKKFPNVKFRPVAPDNLRGTIDG